MTFDFKKLLKKWQTRIGGRLGSASTNPEATRIEGPDSAAQEVGSKPPDSTPEAARFQSPRWDVFFNSLLHPQAVPEWDPGTDAVAGTNLDIMPPPSSADYEDMMHRFAGRAETLKAQLDQLPDIRQSRVDSLQQAMAEGRYQIDPQQIAAAMLADRAFDLR